MLNGIWHHYTMKVAVRGKLIDIPIEAMSDKDAISRFYIQFFRIEERSRVVDAYELTSDETGEVLMKRYSEGILDYI